MVQPDDEVVTNRLVDACTMALEAGLNPPGRPALLYHFTGGKELQSIVEKHEIWASLATALDDPSEIRYATKLAKDYLSRYAGTDCEFRKAMLANLNGAVLSPYGSFFAEAYIFSFCPNKRSKLHWDSSYGRKGTGYALGFDAAKVQCTPFELVPILYKKDRQIDAIEQLCRAAEGMTAELSQKQSHNIAQEIKKAAADIVATCFLFLAPRIKDPKKFKWEDEWRLITYELFHNGTRYRGGVDLHKDVRDVNGREVPYIVNNFAGCGLPLTEVLVGPQAADKVGGKPIRAILDNAGLPAVSVKRIPLQPSAGAV